MGRVMRYEDVTYLYATDKSMHKPYVQFLFVWIIGSPTTIRKAIVFRIEKAFRVRRRVPGLRSGVSRISNRRIHQVLQRKTFSDLYVDARNKL